MALLCGCDYCPDGIGGIGRDGVLKLFNKYKEQEILERYNKTFECGIIRIENFLCLE